MWKQFIGQLLCAFTGHSWIRSSTKVQGKKVSICGRCFKTRITPGSKIAHDRQPEATYPE